ncbi:hypothetical protein CSC19_4299 [Enterobacter hormaechei]|nr:hypothetical protein CSC19_4299 [Enterobacter hormaechei]
MFHRNVNRQLKMSLSGILKRKAISSPLAKLGKRPPLFCELITENR